MDYPDFELYYLDMKYVRNLKDKLGKEGEHIPSVSPQRHKENRPILGLIVVHGDTKYCVPLTSAKNKPKIYKMRNKIDFTKIIIEDKVVAAINFCDMFPVEERQLSKINLKIKKRDTQGTIKNKVLLKAELDWCNENKQIIWNKAIVLYKKYISDEPFERKSDCVNFIKAEAICKDYNKNLEEKNIIIHKRNEIKKHHASESNRGV